LNGKDDANDCYWKNNKPTNKSIRRRSYGYQF
jgi:hypothetical protein